MCFKHYWPSTTWPSTTSILKYILTPSITSIWILLNLVGLFLTKSIKHSLHDRFLLPWDPYAAFEMTRQCHIEGSMVTAAWTHLWMLLNSMFRHFIVKCWILLKPVLEGVDGTFHFHNCPRTRLNQASNQVCNIFNFVVIGVLWGSGFLYFTSWYQWYQCYSHSYIVYYFVLF
jgi:hypothetical protein